MSIKISQKLGIDADKTMVKELHMVALTLHDTPLLHKQQKNIRWIDLITLLSEQRFFVPHTAQPKHLVEKLDTARPFTLLQRKLNCNYTQINRLCNRAKINPNDISLGAGLKLMEFYSNDGLKLIEDINQLLKIDISKYWEFQYV